MIYLVIFFVLMFVIYKTMTQSGNKSMNLYADKNSSTTLPPCPPGQVRTAKYYNMCTNDPSKDPDFEDLCPLGKVPVGKECKCLPLSINPDCVGKKFQSS